jgi:hypothetical protein
MFEEKTFENIVDFEFTPTQIITLGTKNEIKFISKKDFKLESKIIFKEKIQNNIKFEEGLIINNNTGNGYLIENNEKLAFNFYLLRRCENLLLGIKNGKFIIYNLKNNTENIIAIPSSLIFLLEDGKLFSRLGNRKDTNKLNCFDIYKNKQVWEFDLDNLAEPTSRDSHSPESNWRIIKIIGKTDSDIWLALNHHTIVSFNLVSGILTNQISEISTFKSDWLPSAIPNPENTIIIDNKIIGFAWEFIWTIDAKNHMVEFQDLTNKFKIAHCRNDLNYFHKIDSKLIFITKHPSKLNVFDQNTEEIIWTKKFEKINNETPTFNTLKGDDNMFGVLGLNNNLLIFR